MIVLLLVSMGYAEPASVTTTSPEIGGDVEPPVLLAQAVLHYPQEALKEQLHGTVLVQVLISEQGTIGKATILSGESLFHEEALTAAKRLQFQPATQNSKPIAYQTTIEFHFSPPHIEPKGEDHPSHSIVVSSDSLHNRSSHVEERLSEETVDAHRQTDLARSIEHVAGVQFASGASNNAKPLIRGQTERRLQIIGDGIAHASQKWGVDHAPEIDMFDVGEIRVRKGAEAVRYGGDAIGGVILIDSPSLPTFNGIKGKVLTGVATNGQKVFTMGRLDGRQGSWAGRIQGNLLSSEDLSTPTYILGNTASQVWNLGSVLEHQGSLLDVTLRVGHHHNQSGVFYGMRSESPSEFEQQLTSTRPVQADLWSADRSIDKPFQQVDHTKGSALFAFDPSWGKVDLRYAYQRNDRVESEPSRNSTDSPQYNFLLHTHTLDLHSDHTDWMFGTTEIDFDWGLSGKVQDNIYTGLPLIPNYRQFDLGGYAMQRAIFSQASMSIGARVDSSLQDAYLSQDDYEAHARRDLLPNDCEQYSSQVTQCTTRYNGHALVLGGVWQIVPESLEIRGDLSTGMRFPNVDERYLLGAAPSFPVFAMGDPNLPREEVRSATMTFGYRNHWMALEASGYFNQIDNYINFAPSVEAGSVQNVTLAQGTFPIYRFQSVDAQFYGVDGQWTLLEDRPVETLITGAVVRALDSSSNQQLVGTPPDTLRLQTGWQTELWSIQPSVSWVGRQSRVPVDLDFAPAPEAFWLLNLQASWQHTILSQILTWNIQAENIFNTQYRRYTSLLRYYADAPGRNVQLSLTTIF